MLGEIIPHEFFDGFSTWWLWVLVGGAMAALIFGADRFVSAAVRLAMAVGVPTIIIGATVVSLGTTMPEACVSISAALDGQGGLALGNAVGSIACNTALVFGMGCLLVRLKKDRFVLRRHGWLHVGLVATLTGLALAAWWYSGDIEAVFIPREVGFVLVAALVGYMVISAYWARQHPEIIPAQAQATINRQHVLREAGLSVMLLIFGLVLILGGSRVMIGSVTVICSRYGVPPEVLAVTLVALGTSLPELVTAIAAMVKGHSELLVGNVIGANILNVLFVVGGSVAVGGLKIEPYFFYLYLPVMTAAVIYMTVCALSGRGKTFRRYQGIPLLVLYVVFCILTVKLGLR